MPTKLVLHDPDLKKLASRKLEIGTYSTDTVKLVVSCTFYLVHPNTRHLQEVTIYIASNNRSVLLSGPTMFALGFIHPHTRLDYLPPRASLIASSADHPKKTMSQVNVCVSGKECTMSKVSDQKGKYPSLLQAKTRFYKFVQMFLML